MLRFALQNLVVSATDNINYLRIDVSGLVQTAALAPQLDSPEVWTALKNFQLRNVALNFGGAWKFGTEDIELVTGAWAQRAAQQGVQRASVIVQSQIMQMMRAILVNAAARASGAGVDVRFFESAQFDEGFEAVAWFV